MHKWIGEFSQGRLIAGLGNPGPDYQYTRHNLGFLVVDRVAQKIQFKFRLNAPAQGRVAEGEYEGGRLCLLMPTTYMNNSGAAVARLVQKKGIAPSNVLVISDDFHLDFGKIRLRGRGSDGGHNGLASVIASLGFEDFARVRVGIGRPPARQGTVDFVLERFRKEELAELDEVVDQAAECCLRWSTDGLAAAMEQYNGKNQPK